MSIIIESELGWFVDHQFSIDSTFAVTQLTSNEFSKENLTDVEQKASKSEMTDDTGCTLNHSTNHQKVSSFGCNPDIFAIWQPFLMDSQYKKAINSNAAHLQANLTETNAVVGEGVQSCLEYCEDSKNRSLVTSDVLDGSVICATGDSLNVQDLQETQPSMERNRVIKRKKRKRSQPLNSGEKASMEAHLKISHFLSTALEQLRNILLETGYNATVAVHDNNLTARRAALTLGLGDALAQRCQQTAHLDVDLHDEQNLPQAISCDSLRSDQDICNIVVEQPGRVAVMRTLMGSNFLIPAQSRFLLSDFTRLEPLLFDARRYDCLVLDPPWENKSVKRKKTYSTLSDWDLLKLPIRKLCNQNALVLVWVTNKHRQQDFVKEQLFRKWNISYLAKWYWLKVTKSLQTVHDLNSIDSFKRPYECILLGRINSTESENILEIPLDRVIVSVPCSIHSRKPPLNDILKQYLPQNAKCLEMFARSLLPEWTSWGNEVLAFQHLDFFEQKICTENICSIENKGDYF